MDQNTDFSTLRDGLYGIIGHPSITSINLSESIDQNQMPNAFASTQSAPDLMLPQQATYFPSTYMFHPSISNPYWNPHHDPAYTPTNVSPPYYLPNLPSYHSFQSYERSLFPPTDSQMNGATPRPLPTAPPTAYEIPENLATAPPTAPDPVPTAPPPANPPVNTNPRRPPPPVPPCHNINPFNPFNNPPVPPPVPPPPIPHVQPQIIQPQPYYHPNFAQPYFPNAPFPPQQQFFNNNQQYFPQSYLPTYTNNSDSNIPTTTHIQELKSRADWAAWYQGIENVLTARGLLNHICEPPAANVPWTALNAPSYPPVLPPGHMHVHVHEWQNWYRRDAIAFGVITSRLSREILGMIPLIQDPSTGTR